jgi:hypothetical protein
MTPYHVAYDIATKWIMTLGWGFHPDHNACDYEPPMRPEMAMDYDYDIRKLRMIDPQYNAATDAFSDFDYNSSIRDSL